MEHAEIGRARANALLTNGVITAGFVALMLCAGLWPFTFAPSNNAVFDKKGGISFSRPAAIFDADTLNPAEKAVLAESTVTIAIRVSPSGESPWFISQIVTFTDGNRLCAIVGQWKSHLVLKTFPDRTRAGREPSAEVAVRNILNAGTTRDIVIVTGRAGTKIFVDNHHALDDQDFRLFPGRAGGPLRLSLGGSLSGKYTWNGTLFCFSLIAGDASERLTNSANAAPCAACEGERKQGAIMGFSFEEPGSLVRNCAGVRHSLVIRDRFPVIGGNVLVPFWDDFTNDASYYSDIAVNLLGFIPFGFFLARFLSQVNGMGRRRVVAAVVAAGFVLSLGIELSQVFLPGRSSQLSDLICNTIGSFAGAHLCFRLSLFHPRQPARK